jgi:hypothetical protein
MTRKLLIVTAALLIIFSLQAQARSGAESHQRLQLNTAGEVSFESTSTDVGNLVVINGNEHIVQPKNTFDLAGQNLRFTPNDVGGYDVSTPEDVEFVQAFGDVLQLSDDDSKKVEIEFDFPFFGEEYTELFVNSDGNLTFGKGDAASLARDLQRFLAESPRIGVLYTDLNPFDPFPDPFGGETPTVEVKQSSKQVTVTWFNVEAFSEQSFGSVASLTMQVVLYDTGVIDIVFEKSDVRTGIVGVSPGGLDDAFQVNLVDYSDNLPFEGTTGAIAEVFVDLPTVNLQNVAREFYRTHNDDFDSLILFTNFESNLDFVGVLAFAINVQNDVLGIGNPNRSEIFPQFDDTAEYGSQGRLKSFLTMKNLKVWEDDPLENTFGPATSTLSVLTHEFGHTWIAFIDPPVLLTQDRAHWNFFLHTDGSLLGGNDIQDNGDGSFITLAPKNIYGPLDLYLMGLLKPEDVPPTFLVTDPHDLDLPPPYDQQTITSDQLQSIYSLGDVGFRGDKQEVRIEDIIAVNGARIPDAESSQKDFRTAFILLAMGEDGPTPDEIDRVESVRLYWPAFFHRAANNLATMVSTLDGSPEDVRLPSEDEPEEERVYTYTLNLDNGLNIISPPLRPETPLTARSFMEIVGSTVIIAADDGEFVSHTVTTPGDGFPIEGGRGYIINTPEGGAVTFTGDPWDDSDSTQAVEAASAPAANGALWAFVVDGILAEEGFQESYQITIDNLRTGNRLMEGLAEAGGRFTLGYADLNRTPVVQVGDTVRLTFTNIASDQPIGKTDYVITPDDIQKAYTTLHLTFDSIVPMHTQLLQNYPNPFNPETWIPYQLASDTDVTVTIYDTESVLVRQLDLGYQQAGYYTDRMRAAYWDGRNHLGESVGSGIYFYQLRAGDYATMRKMVILK